MRHEPLLERMPTTRMPSFSDREGGLAGERPRYAEEASSKIHGGCGLMGLSLIHI